MDIIILYHVPKTIFSLSSLPMNAKTSMQRYKIRYRKEEASTVRGRCQPHGSFLGANGIPRIQLIIPAFFLEQLFVAPPLNDATVFQDHNTVGVFYRGQTMSDDKGCASFHQPIHAVLYQGFRTSIDGGCGFIQNQNRGSATAALAMARSCRCPWLKFAPSPVKIVWYPSGSRRINPSALASLAAAIHSSSVASKRP